MSQKNVICSITRSYAAWEIAKDDDATVDPMSSIQTAQKVGILTMRIKELKLNMEPFDYRSIMRTVNKFEGNHH